MMKKRLFTILLVLIMFTVAFTLSFYLHGTAAQFGADMTTNRVTAGSSKSYGGGYVLSGRVGQASRVSAGGHYRLTSSQDAPAEVDQCCCTYLPCIIK